MLICPVCAKALKKVNNALRCENGHSFDTAKEGYVNLLISGKPGGNRGDSKEMAVSRRDFLNKGYFSPLAQAVCDCAASFGSDGDAVLDICCGEGYYTQYLSERLSRDFYGFDLSKSMVRLAAKRRCGASFFVANISSIPVKDKSVKLAFHLFAPFHSREFRRVISDDGVIVTAVAGREHLYELKQILYPEPYFNDECEPEHDGLRLSEKISVKDRIELKSRAEIDALFRMTPYFYHTPTSGMQRLNGLDSLSVTADFVLYIYKPGEKS